MGTFRYYAPHSNSYLPGPLGIVGNLMWMAAVTWAVTKWERYEEVEETGTMANNTYLYFRHRTSVSQDKDRPSFPRMKFE